MGAGLSLSGSPQPDLQGIADARPTLRIPHIHRGAASTIDAGEYLDIPQRSKRRGEAYAVRYVELRCDARTKMVAIFNILLTAAYHAANDPNADTEQDVAG
jgi:hypothetical protein